MKYIIATGSLLLLVGSSCTGLDKLQSGIETYQDTKALLGGSSDHHTVIVAGYGTPVKGNTTYQDYIKAVATYVSNEANNVDSVVFTGGYTDDQNLSEAESMNSYFNTQVSTNRLHERGVKVLKEECSIVSWQNISYSQELLLDKDITPTQVTLFGDENRSDKLKTFAIYKFNLSAGLPNNVTDLVNQSLNATSVDYQGFDFGDSADTEDARKAKFAAEVLGAYDTEVGNELLQKRLDDWSDTYGYDVADNLVKKGCSQYAGF
ncbi:MAG: hypothetical protein ACD_41C00188G0005 [uncultured bacterium]|nr:MAG: hypothetical protein ACD_41C00188G0005 [uncultured bacterium]HBY73065.1 hypothetical protein [Candidatus Kerfeldbacteria bacterium]